LTLILLPRAAFCALVTTSPSSSSNDNANPNPFPKGKNTKKGGKIWREEEEDEEERAKAAVDHGRHHSGHDNQHNIGHPSN
jgi:hypothetical protein